MVGSRPHVSRCGREGERGTGRKRGGGGGEEEGEGKERKMAKEDSVGGKCQEGEAKGDKE